MNGELWEKVFEEFSESGHVCREGVEVLSKVVFWEDVVNQEYHDLEERERERERERESRNIFIPHVCKHQVPYKFIYSLPRNKHTTLYNAIYRFESKTVEVKKITATEDYDNTMCVYLATNTCKLFLRSTILYYDGKQSTQVHNHKTPRELKQSGALGLPPPPPHLTEVPSVRCYSLNYSILSFTFSVRCSSNSTTLRMRAARILNPWQ